MSVSDSVELRSQPKVSEKLNRNSSREKDEEEPSKDDTNASPKVKADDKKQNYDISPLIENRI